MHIPDGYLSPQTWAPATAVMVPLWAWASARLKATLRLRQVPMLALGAAFSFVIMMFNVPIPGGTTGHAVGAVLIAILLGPWAAMIAVSLALVVQALLFGDGGITAIGANCLNMAVVMPVVGYWTYRLIAGRSQHAMRRIIAGALGGYVGLNAAALTTAIMFGIQPLLARDAAGRALFNPFGLGIAVPMMMLEHLLIFGLVEAVVTGFVLAYIQRTDPVQLAAGVPAPETGRRNLAPRLGLALGILALLSPLGIILPAYFNAGSAWGEWNAEEIREEMVKVYGTAADYVPTQLERIGSWWHAPMPDYALPGQESASLPAQGLAYILSAVVGMLMIVGVLLLLRRTLARKEHHGTTAGVDAPVGHV